MALHLATFRILSCKRYVELSGIGEKPGAGAEEALCCLHHRLDGRRKLLRDPQHVNTEAAEKVTSERDIKVKQFIAPHRSTTEERLQNATDGATPIMGHTQAFVPENQGWCSCLRCLVRCPV